MNGIIDTNEDIWRRKKIINKEKENQINKKGKKKANLFSRRGEGTQGKIF